MEKTLYTAIIEANDGIHLIRKNISDPTAEYEDFEIAMENKADDLDGELHCIYADEDIVEDVTLNSASHISIDNGNSFCNPEEALQRFDIDTIAVYMNDSIRERVHAELAPCSDIDFLRRYLELSPDDLIIG